jgi:hypothetical protein
MAYIELVDRPIAELNDDVDDLVDRNDAVEDAEIIEEEKIAEKS